MNSLEDRILSKEEGNFSRVHVADEALQAWIHLLLLSASSSNKMWSVNVSQLDIPAVRSRLSQNLSLHG